MLRKNNILQNEGNKQVSMLFIQVGISEVTKKEEAKLDL